jgi:hypothetical protein
MLCRLAFESVTGNDIVVVPALPSFTFASPTESAGRTGAPAERQRYLPVPTTGG